MRKLGIIAGVVVLAVLSLGAAPASAEPFYCDSFGPSAAETIQCGSTGVCYWEYLGNGLWLEKCLPYCDIYYCG